VLALTPQGKKKYDTIKEVSKMKLVPRLEKRSSADLKKLHEALQILSEVFSEKK
jgi:hypothetical protein